MVHRSIPLERRCLQLAQIDARLAAAAGAGAVQPRAPGGAIVGVKQAAAGAGAWPTAGGHRRGAARRAGTVCTEHEEGCQAARGVSKEITCPPGH